MATWGTAGHFLYTVFATTAAESGETKTVGNADIPVSSTTGADINTLLANTASNLASVATEEWNDLVSLSGSYQVFMHAGNSVSVPTLGLIVAATEDSGDGTRMQVLVDGTVAGDVTCIGDGANAIEMAIFPPGAYTSTAGDGAYEPIYCRTSFKIRATRKGTFAIASSQVNIPRIWYYTVSIA